MAAALKFAVSVNSRELERLKRSLERSFKSNSLSELCNSQEATAAEPDMGKPKAPEWNDVTILKESEKAGGNYQVKCGHCDFVFVGGATRISAHFLGQIAAGVKKKH